MQVRFEWIPAVEFPGVDEELLIRRDEFDGRLDGFECLFVWNHAPRGGCKSGVSLEVGMTAMRRTHQHEAESDLVDLDLRRCTTQLRARGLGIVNRGRHGFWAGGRFKSRGYVYLED